MNCYILAFTLKYVISSNKNARTCLLTLLFTLLITQYPYSSSILTLKHTPY